MERVKFENPLANIYFRLFNGNYDAGECVISIEELGSKLEVATYHLDIEPDKYIVRPCYEIRKYFPNFKIAKLGVHDEFGLVVYGFQFDWQVND